MMNGYEQILSPEWKQKLYFFAINFQINKFNPELRGRDKFVWNFVNNINKIKLKLNAFKCQLEDSDFTFSRRCK